MHLDALISLARRGCCEGMVGLSSSTLASELGTSQQTASRRIQRMEKEGYVVREILPRGQKVKITSKGMGILRKVHSEMGRIFEGAGAPSYTIEGEVVSGMGEGRYYIEISGYRSQFKKKLGFEPYPGTLNLKLKTAEDIRLRRMLEDFDGIKIEGFKQGNRTFGSAKCFRATLNGIEGAVVIPSRTHHSFNLLEFIAPEKVRDMAKLRDGETVAVKIFVNV